MDNHLIKIITATAVTRTTVEAAIMAEAITVVIIAVVTAVEIILQEAQL